MLEDDDDGGGKGDRLLISVFILIVSHLTQIVKIFISISQSNNIIKSTNNMLFNVFEYLMLLI